MTMVAAVRHDDERVATTTQLSKYLLEDLGVFLEAIRITEDGREHTGSGVL